MKLLALATLIFLVSIFSPAQERSINQSGSIIARLSYENTAVRGVREERSPHLCFALRTGGFYQIARLTSFDGWQQSSGKLSMHQLTTLQNMLSSVNFQHRGGVVRTSAERFVLDISEGARVRRSEWLNTDDTLPLPPLAEQIIRRIQQLPSGEHSNFDWESLTDSEICPSGETLRLDPASLAK